jgi:mRNA interferase RelE/StbE
VSYRLEWKRSAVRILHRLDKPTRDRILEAVRGLVENGTGDVKTLHGEGTGRYRLRVGGWRVIFDRDDDAHVITVVRLGPRGDVYR